MGGRHIMFDPKVSETQYYDEKRRTKSAPLQNRVGKTSGQGIEHGIDQLVGQEVLGGIEVKRPFFRCKIESEEVQQERQNANSNDTPNK